MTTSAPHGIGRNTGIDLLRLFSMFLVVVLHVLGHGGVLRAAEEAMGPQYRVAWLMEIGAYCAVDCFALVTGYVMSRSSYKPSRIVALWLQVLCYSLGVELLVCLLNRTVDVGRLIRSATPVLSVQYWYVTAYFGLFLLMPFLNIALRRLTKKGLMLLCGVGLVLFSVVTPYTGEIFGTGGGYSMIWLTYLYIAGWFFGTCGEYVRIPSGVCWLAIAVSLAATYVLKVYFSNPVLVNYVSLTILCIAVSLLLLFSRWKPRESIVKFTRLLSPAYFSIYLIHEQPTISQFALRDRLTALARLHAPEMALSVVGIALGICALCMAVDLVRLRVFQWIGVPKLCEWIDRKTGPLNAEIEKWQQP